MSRAIAMWLAGSVLAVTWWTGRPIAAQEPDDRARELFLEGREEVQRGDVEAGCRKLFESHELAPEAVGPMLNVADCDERAGRLATAWRRFRRAAELAPPDDHRRQFAAKRAEALEPRVPRVRLELPADAPEGTRVTQDGVDLDEGALGATRMLDPGVYRFVVHAPGHHDRAFEVVLTASMVHRMGLQLGPPTAELTRIGDPPPTTISFSTPPAGPADDGLSGRAMAGWVTGGVGAAGIVLGIVTGVLVAVHAGTYDDHCDDQGNCDQEGLDAASAGKPLAIVSPVSFAIGGAAVAVAIPLLLSSPEMSAVASSHAIAAGDRGFALQLGGVF
jgi:hypothetical protein